MNLRARLHHGAFSISPGGVASFADGDCKSGRVQLAMRNADQDFGNAFFFTEFSSRPTQPNSRLPARLIPDFDIRPMNPLGPTRADGFKNCFFGGPSSRVVLRCCLALATVLDFVIGKHSRNEKRIVFLDHFGDSCTFDDIGADSNHIHFAARDCVLADFSPQAS